MSDLDGASGYLVLSPHLDDAVLSCGGLLHTVAAKVPVTVATIFTDASPPPHTRAARKFLRACGFPDAASLYAARQAEDRAVLDGMGVRHLHLGFADALFRRRSAATGRAAHLVPELAHRYPTYRFDIARGRIARGDAAVTGKLVATIRRLLAETGAELLLCPIGVGRHVDHLITREAGEHFPEQVVYYADFPYSLSAAPDPVFAERQGLVAETWDRGITEKRTAIEGYGTQAPLLFPGGSIPERPETYFRRA